MTRCPWARNPLAIAYHDTEWGVPVYDDRRLFEFLILEGAQAGLSWDTILKKRDHYRTVFDAFDPERIARYDRRKVARLLADPGIVRNRLKVEATITNAQALLRLVEEGSPSKSPDSPPRGPFAAYLWQFVGGRPIVNRRRQLQDVPARTAESDAMAKDLKRRGFRFVGTTICYALMQAVGMVNDHLVTCPRHREV